MPPHPPKIQNQTDHNQLVTVEGEVAPVPQTLRERFPIVDKWTFPTLVDN